MQKTWEMWVQSLDWEDLLKKEMATHSSILAGIIPWTEEPGGIQSMGSQRVDMTEQLSMRACKWVKFPIKSQRMTERKEKNMIQYMLSLMDSFITQSKNRLKIKGWENMFHANKSKDN